jgi:hypothetical protein
MAPAERICPVCRGEFVDELESCPDCGVLLTQRSEVELGGEPTDTEDLVTLVETSDATLLPVLTGLLESAEIPSVIHGADQAGLYLAAGKLSSLFGLEARGARLMVARRDLEEAQAILAEVEPEGSDEGR